MAANPDPTAGHLPPARLWRADDLQLAAEESLPPDVFGFIAGGAGDEVALRRNLSAFRDLALQPRVLARAGSPECAVELLGQRLSAPVLIAPMGMQRLVHPDGELATAAAARALGLGYVLASGSSVALEQVAEIAGPSRWFQLYLLKDRAVSADLVLRAVAAGYAGIVLTVDVPVVGDRPRDQRSRLAPPPAVRNANFEPYDSISAGYHAYVSDLDSDIGWPDLAWLVDLAGKVPVIVKGILRPDDALRAVEHGAAGIVVSNHGGRQLGRAIPAIDALPPIAEAVGHQITVLLDSGVRSAADVAAAIALGADAVLVGRLAMWALAVGGRQSVEDVLGQLVAELRRTMTLVGARTPDDLVGTVIGSNPTHRDGR